MDDELDLRDFSGVSRLFPLPGVVLFPHAVLPLHIFEQRYRQMTEDAIGGDRFITIVQVKPEAESLGLDEPEIEEVGCLGRILHHERLADGRFNFLLLGRKRVRLTREIDRPTLYRQAEVEILDDAYPVKADPTASPELIELFRALASGQGGLDPDMEKILTSGLPLGPLTDLIAHALGFPPKVKQVLLAEPRVDRRADGLRGMMRHLVEGEDRPARSDRPFPPPFSVN